MPRLHLSSRHTVAPVSLDGRQILQSSTVEAAFTNQIGELDFPPTITSADTSSTCDFNIGPG